LEEQFSELTTQQAVYFAVSNELTESLVSSIPSAKAPTAIDQIYNIFAENAFQISSTISSSSNAWASPQFTNIIVRLIEL
jgi:hypothetical protein